MNHIAWALGWATPSYAYVLKSILFSLNIVLLADARGFLKQSLIAVSGFNPRAFLNE